MVAPQVVGQAQPTKFCEILGIQFTTVPELKKYIQTHLAEIIPILVSYTFDCPNIYYNVKENTIRYITSTTPIDWKKYDFKWTCAWSDWKNSSTLKIVIDKKSMPCLSFSSTQLEPIWQFAGAMRTS